MVFSRDGRTWIAGGDGGILRYWDVATMAVARSVPAHAGRIFGVAASRDGTLIATAGGDKAVKL